MPELLERFHVGGFALDPITLDEAVRRIVELRSETIGRLVVTANVDHLSRLRKDGAFRRAYSAASLRLADGMPIVAASRLTARPLPERVTGADLLPALCAEAARRGLRVMLLGSSDETLAAAMTNLRACSPGLDICGHAPPEGFASNSAARQAAVRAVQVARPALLLVALGAPAQETWAAEHLHDWPGTVAVGVGAAVDFAAGRIRRAPQSMQRYGLEWTYRLMQEPKRLWRRYLLAALPVVPVLGRAVVRGGAEH